MLESQRQGPPQKPAPVRLQATAPKDTEDAGAAAAAGAAPVPTPAPTPVRLENTEADAKVTKDMAIVAGTFAILIFLIVVAALVVRKTRTAGAQWFEGGGRVPATIRVPMPTADDLSSLSSLSTAGPGPLNF